MIDTNDFSARPVIIAAITLQAMGKVLYGTWLENFPATLFVCISFTLTALFFLSTSKGGIGVAKWGTLLFLNVATAITFLSLFLALKLIQPAIVGAVEISVGPIAAVVISFLLHRKAPTGQSILVCGIIMAGCLVLGVSAFSGTGFQASNNAALIGLLASFAAGIGAVLITIASKSLLRCGWKFGAVLAHRFYVIVAVSLGLVWFSDMPSIQWSVQLSLLLLLVTSISVLVPLYLLQVGISRCDPYTVMVTMAALPVLTFFFEGFSSKYQWSCATAAGLIVITSAVLWDVSVRKK
ncbi:hypothetical protein [uncultured Sulfitobacter sp.]|uniref:EamA family transporter n=1 Tax=uncultured Sulfitobacter sp. TaxID=191468 RepID=UPI0030F5FF19